MQLHDRAAILFFVLAQGSLQAQTSQPSGQPARFDPVLPGLLFSNHGISNWIEAHQRLHGLDHYGYSAGYVGTKTGFSELYDWYSNFGTTREFSGLLHHPNPAVRMLGIELLTEKGTRPSPVPLAFLAKDEASTRSWDGCVVGTLSVRQLVVWRERTVNH